MKKLKTAEFTMDVMMPSERPVPTAMDNMVEQFEAELRKPIPATDGSTLAVFKPGGARLEQLIWAANQRAWSNWFLNHCERPSTTNEEIDAARAQCQDPNTHLLYSCFVANNSSMFLALLNFLKCIIDIDRTSVAQYVSLVFEHPHVAIPGNVSFEQHLLSVCTTRPQRQRFVQLMRESCLRPQKPVLYFNETHNLNK
jgi:hypothetical protein